MELAFRVKCLRKSIKAEFYHNFCVQELHRKRHGARHDKLLWRMFISYKVYAQGKINQHYSTQS